MRPATDWKENVAADEAERFERYAGIFEKLQRKGARGGPLSRALHAKGKAGVEAELIVQAELPEHARVGIFAAPGRYRAYVRFSNGSAMRQPDPKPDVRGVAIKVLGVPGQKLIPGMENAPTQDFLMIRTSALPFRTADDFVALVVAMGNPLLALPRLVSHFGLGGALRLLKQLSASLSVPMTPLAATRYYSAAPTRFGPHAVRYALQPHDPVRPDPLHGRSPGYLRDGLAERLRQGPVQYDFKVQFFCDEARTPIEDTSKDWLEADAPYLTVARLVLQQQDVDSPRGKRVAEFVEKLSFDPWHAPLEFRPLGNTMRARNHAYRRSTMARGAAPEPDGTERFD